MLIDKVKEYKIYLFVAIAILLAVVYFSIPAKASESKENIVASVQIKKENKEEKTPLSDLDAQNYKILNEKIIYLNKQLNSYKSLQNNGKDELEKLYSENEKLKSQSDSLLEKINELEHKISNEELLVNNKNKEFFEEAINKLNNDLAEYKSENDSLKLSLNDKENQIKNLNNLMQTLSNQRQMEEFEKDNNKKQVENKINEYEAKLQASLKNNKDLNKENDVLKERIKNLSKLENVNVDLNKKINEINLQNLEYVKEISAANKLNKDLNDKFNADVAKLNLENKDLSNKLNESKAQIVKLTQANENLQNNANKNDILLSQNEGLKNDLFQSKLSLENYKNEQGKKIQKINEEHQKALLKIQSELNALSKDNNQLKAENSKLLISIKNAEVKNKELNEKLNMQSKNNLANNDALNNQNDKIQEYLSQIDGLKKDIEKEKNDKFNLAKQITNLNEELLKYKKGLDTNSKVALLQEQNTSLQKQLENLQNNEFKLNTTSITKYAQMQCDNLPTGKVKLDDDCERRLKDFLAKYKQDYIYEITAIINNGGFRSLNAALDNKQISEQEVARLTKLANIGLAKDRIALAADYIKNNVKNAIISSNVEPVYSKDKKGFILRVYK